MPAVSLDDDLDALAELDTLRIEFARLRDKALKALAGDEAVGNQPRLYAADDAARVLGFFGRQVSTSTRQRLASASVVTSRPLEILENAELLQAFAAVPSEIWRSRRSGETVAALLHRLVRELYTATPPDWILGGARAGIQGQVSPISTLEVVRALGRLADCFDRTADLFSEVEDYIRKRERTRSLQAPEAWKQEELRRQALAFYVSSHRSSCLLLIPVALGQADDPGRPASVDRGVDLLSRTTTRYLKNAAEAFKRAKQTLGRRSLPRTHLGQNASAHQVAQKVVTTAADLAGEARKAHAGRNWRSVAAAFRRAGASIRQVLRPAVNYSGTILDRELASAAGGHPWDPGALATGAVAFGLAGGDWRDERLERACGSLLRVVSERGVYPASRPFFVDNNGSFPVAASKISSCLAELLQRSATHEVSPVELRRVLALFTQTSVSHIEGIAWRSEDDPSEAATAEVSVDAIFAVARLNGALDRVINERVYRHFSVRRQEQLRQGISLDQVFYGDYGFHLAPKGIRRSSIALLLERARGHIAGFGRQKAPWTAAHSIVLYGPPGTGKTTLVEALAASSNVPLVELTPSDIIVGGGEKVESRTRAVFRALSLLTRTVILFDEFDPVILDRDPSSKRPEARSVFEFLTPGMLPKLKHLHRAARGRRCVYFLITNLIGALDDAAIRDGRFDHRIGVYPPDPLSRTGRLAAVCGRVRPNAARFNNVVVDAAGKGMERLARRGWFSEDAADVKGAPLAYIRSGGRRPAFPVADAEVGPSPKSGRKEGILDWQQWKWVTEWDASVKRDRRTVLQPPKRLQRAS